MHHKYQIKNIENVSAKVILIFSCNISYLLVSNSDKAGQKFDYNFLKDNSQIINYMERISIFPKYLNKALTKYLNKV